MKQVGDTMPALEIDARTLSSKVEVQRTPINMYTNQDLSRQTYSQKPCSDQATGSLQYSTSIGNF
jgi:hypothetical protein